MWAGKRGPRVEKPYRAPWIYWFMQISFPTRGYHEATQYSRRLKIREITYAPIVRLQMMESDYFNQSLRFPAPLLYRASRLNPK